MASHLKRLTIVLVALGSLCCCAVSNAAGKKDPRVERCISRGLDWVANTQSRLGKWAAKDGMYPTAMTALAGVALLQEGSTTTQGKYAPNIRRAVDYLCNHSRSNGLIGDPTRDDRYTYGHGYSMLFLSQVLGEEEDEARRQGIDSSAHQGRRILRPGSDRRRGLGLCERQRRRRF